MAWYSSDFITVPHGMFCCHGGVSRTPYTSLNLSYGVGDREAAVLANRQFLKTEMGIKYLASAHQVHGEGVIKIDPEKWHRWDMLVRIPRS